MATRRKLDSFTRRERQILDVLYRLGRASVGQVLAHLAHKPNYSTVRTQLTLLERKGYVRHEEEGLRYVYTPVVPRGVARRAALRRVVETFFDGSVEKVVTALLDGGVTDLSPAEYDRLARLVARHRKERSS
jgi:BlaI family transcriptional regulator, penicillinase repressor